MPRIRFIASGSSAVFGNFAAGDELTCGEAAADHFVNQARAAEFVSAPAAPAAAADQAAAPTPAALDPQLRARRRSTT